MAFRLGYRPALDGVRGLAILTVMCVHTAMPFVSGGFLSVDLFFVLSGFLITSVLLEEWEKAATIRLGNFYIRRGLRLIPGLVVLLAALGAYSTTLFIRETAVELWREMVFTFFYVTNWALAFDLMPAMGMLGHAWTLAIEEQFYMLWPVLLLTMLRAGLSRRRILAVTAAAIAVAALHRAVMWEMGFSIDRLFFGFDTRCDSLLAGCVGALYASLPDRHESPAVARALRAATVLAGFVVVAMVLFAVREEAYMFKGGFTLMALASSILLLAVVDHPEGLLARFLAWPPLVHAGRVSYGLYLWHWPIFLYLNPAWFDLDEPYIHFLRFAATFVMAELSARLVERPCLKWKGRWSATAAPTAYGALTAAASARGTDGPVHRS